MKQPKLTLILAVSSILLFLFSACGGAGNGSQSGEADSLNIDDNQSIIRIDATNPEEIDLSARTDLWQNIFQAVVNELTILCEDFKVDEIFGEMRERLQLDAGGTRRVRQNGVTLEINELTGILSLDQGRVNREEIIIFATPTPNVYGVFVNMRSDDDNFSSVYTLSTNIFSYDPATSTLERLPNDNFLSFNPNDFGSGFLAKGYTYRVEAMHGELRAMLISPDGEIDEDILRTKFKVHPDYTYRVLTWQNGKLTPRTELPECLMANYFATTMRQFINMPKEEASQIFLNGKIGSVSIEPHIKSWEMAATGRNAAATYAKFHLGTTLYSIAKATLLWVFYPDNSGQGGYAALTIVENNPLDEWQNSSGIQFKPISLNLDIKQSTRIYRFDSPDNCKDETDQILSNVMGITQEGLFYDPEDIPQNLLSKVQSIRIASQIGVHGFANRWSLIFDFPARGYFEDPALDELLTPKSIAFYWDGAAWQDTVRRPMVAQ